MCLGVIPDEAGFRGETPCPDVSSRVRAVISMAGVSDMSKLPARARQGGNRRFLAGDEATYEERVRKASPIHYVSKHAEACCNFLDQRKAGGYNKVENSTQAY